MNNWLYKKLVRPNAVVPQGLLAQFELSSLMSWPLCSALIVGACAYFFAAQQWLMFAFQLWLSYAGGCVALALLHRRAGVRAGVIAAGWKAVAVLLVGSVICAVIGSGVRWFSLHAGTFLWIELIREWPLPILFAVFFCGITLVRDFVISERAIAQRAQQAMERQRQEAAKQAAEAQLRLLQAQIEPHFLLNTLANVRSLVKRDTSRAVVMLDHLSDYLQVALPRMRQNQSTLTREATLSASFLSIMQIRMGARLTFDVDIPNTLNAVVFPPMLLQTLVENSIKHGLEPSAEPGHIHVAARQIDDRLEVTVADTGIGFGQANTGGTGIGLVNIRERLQSLYGETATLTITPNEPRGVVAKLVIPITHSFNQ